MSLEHPQRTVTFVIENYSDVNADMTKGILCSIDFSESSKDALRWSVSLASLLKTNLIVLYTYRLVNSDNGEAVELKKRIEANAMSNFALLEKEILTNKGVNYAFKVEVGFVSNRVKDYARRNGVSFLVMGNKMNINNKESFDELAENVQVPLVIVP
jgi:nucleotide-binding universal stress UspA family protein